MVMPGRNVQTVEGGGLEVMGFGGRGQVFTGDSAETLTMTAESHPLFKSHGRKSSVRFMHSPFKFQTLSIPHWVDVYEVIRTDAFDVSEQSIFRLSQSSYVYI